MATGSHLAEGLTLSREQLKGSRGGHTHLSTAAATLAFFAPVARRDFDGFLGRPAHRVAFDAFRASDSASRQQPGAREQRGRATAVFLLLHPPAITHARLQPIR